MAVRTDVTVDFTVSPRVIEVASPSTEITIQDLWDTLQTISAYVWNASYDALIDNTASGGKQQLRVGKLVGITLTLFNATLQFEARGGPGQTLCDIIDGNLVAIDTNRDPLTPIAGTAFVSINRESDVSAGLLNEQDLENLRKYLENKRITDPVTGKDRVYEDDGTTVFKERDIFEDTAGAQPYRGQGAERVERYEDP